ncbi:MAG: hypothetical protein WEB88_09130 [Gemmatimonadota bacterium]
MTTARSTSLIAAAAALSLALLPGEAQAQADDGTFLPWLGCWEAIAVEPGAGFGEATPILCVRENADGEGIVVATLAGGEVRAERELRADGELTAVAEGGCEGWESVAWSGDGHRLYLSSQSTCEAGQIRTTSGVMALTSATEWLEVQAVDAGADHVPVRARRYRLVSAPSWAPAEVLPRTENRMLAIETARAVASAPLGVREVEEAVRFVMPEVVQGLLVEGKTAFDLDARTLVRLADAGVNEDVLDVMVALDNPDVFELSTEDHTPEMLPQVAQGYAYYDRFGLDRYGRYAGWDMRYGYDPFMRYGYDPYRYGTGGYGIGGYGYDRYGNWYGRGGYGGGPIIIIERPGDNADGSVYQGPRRIRAVKGQGYTADRGSSSAGSSSVSRPASSVGSGSASAGSGTSSTGRKAKPKPKTGGGGGGV